MQRIDYPSLVQKLIQQLRRMPGIGPRSAERIALWMIQKTDARANEIAHAVTEAVLHVKGCVQCGFFSESDRCVICSDPARDQSLLCVVEQTTNILSLERTSAFCGLYHSLGGRLSPLDHIGPEDLRINALVHRIREIKPQEVILALSAGVEGESTANYLGDLLEKEGAQITRIAQGLPAGIGLENADELTLSRALSGRTVWSTGRIAAE